MGWGNVGIGFTTHLAMGWGTVLLGFIFLFAMGWGKFPFGFIVIFAMDWGTMTFGFTLPLAPHFRTDSKTLASVFTVKQSATILSPFTFSASFRHSSTLNS